MRQNKIKSSVFSYPFRQKNIREIRAKLANLYEHKKDNTHTLERLIFPKSFEHLLCFYTKLLPFFRSKNFEHFVFRRNHTCVISLLPPSCWFKMADANCIIGSNGVYFFDEGRKCLFLHIHIYYHFGPPRAPMCIIFHICLLFLSPSHPLTLSTVISLSAKATGTYTFIHFVKLAKGMHRALSLSLSVKWLCQLFMSAFQHVF